MKTLTLKFKDAFGNPLKNGRAFMRLSQDAVALSDSQIAPSLVSIQLDTNGAATQLCYFNDELSPANTTYQITALESGGGLVYGPENFSITGASFNLNTAQPTTIGVMLANPVLQNPTSVQTITGFNLIISGAQLLLADGTAALPGIGFAAEPGTGLSRLTPMQLGFSVNGTSKALLDASGLRMSSTVPVGWSNNVNPFGNPNDTAFSRTALATVALGNGNQGDASGTLKLTTLNMLGLLTNYNGLATTNNGLSVTYGTSDLTAQNASLGPTTLITGTATSGGNYRLNYYIHTTVADASGASVVVTINFTGDGIASSTVSPSVALASTANSQSASVPVHSDNNTNITYTTTVTGAPAAGKYSLHVWVNKE